MSTSSEENLPISLIEPSVFSLSDRQIYFEQRNISSFYFSEQELFAPIDVSSDTSGILEIDNPIEIDSEQDRLQYLYAQREVSEDTEDMLETYELPPVRLNDGSRFAYQVSVP